MLGLILLSLLGTAAVAAATGLFDGLGDQTAEDAVDGADLGPGTLVQPAGTDDLTADDLGDGASVGYAVLLGLRPEDLAGADIRVVLQTPDTHPFAAGSIEAVAAEMGATRL